ncbi:MAG: hypothetical protein HN778_21635 [Prolixibacteraceae bacterium]|jgi:Kdo2-lipid IVA lauroyltransferase/acyltransferase|nr:hypothetical protein [Prolixibacteraceae bacterium]MBT6766048.1 hypothetical protein [Prolixibacteraceae bacterium]MBT6998638.1 hypothetical protein [Prolixibacteraceae bacterium]MBT7397439.1 hypothetical protein [Prolixibacteraceae bacterium]
MKSEIFTQLGIFFLKMLAKFPFPIIYFLSDIFYFVIYYLIAYRKIVVTQNLKKAFPEKSDNEIAQIRKKFFRHLSDLFLESIKMHGMNKNDYRKRMVVKNAGQVNKYFVDGKSVVVVTMHYNNWEWSSSLPLSVKQNMLAIYKPLHNKKFDAFINNSRLKMGADMTQNSLTLRRVLNAEKSGERILTWLAGDQTPPHTQKFWFTFLNQETLFYPGPAFISKRFIHPVFFQRTVKKARGMYETHLELLIENPEKLSEIEITKKYIERMEDVIKEEPEYYLWSHRRWKHKRPGNIPLNN